MFLENTGRLLFKHLRMSLFFAMLATLPLCTGIFLFFQHQSVNRLQEALLATNLRAKTAFEKKDRKERFLKRHADPDPLFLEKQLQSLSFLGQEKVRLKTLWGHPALVNKHLAGKRMGFLNSGENQLLFQEEQIQISNPYKEFIEKQKRPVEMDAEDLNHVLALIEEPIITLDHRPQLIITDFSLHRKQTSLQNEVLEVNFDLLKREFL
jgi:hypothetical protein